jgi:hypothetical protein
MADTASNGASRRSGPRNLRFVMAASAYADPGEGARGGVSREPAAGVDTGDEYHAAATERENRERDNPDTVPPPS